MRVESRVFVITNDDDDKEKKLSSTLNTMSSTSLRIECTKWECGNMSTKTSTDQLSSLRTLCGVYFCPG